MGHTMEVVTGIVGLVNLVLVTIAIAELFNQQFDREG